MVRNKKDNAVEILDCLDEEPDGFIDGEISQGNALCSFNFAAKSATTEVQSPPEAFEFNFVKPSAENLTDTREIKTEANIATPTIDGEAYNIGRFYKLRYSTAKMLNEIKAAHSDVNVYMNTIVDEAVRHYYSSLFKTN